MSARYRLICDAQHCSLGLDASVDTRWWNERCARYVVTNMVSIGDKTAYFDASLVTEGH